MSITDELMEWTRNHTVDCSDNRIALVTIAKRIDAEHQKAIRELNNLADASVLLPVDADGEVIHIGDVMDSRVDYLFDGKPFTVRALVLCEDGWEVADGRFGNRYEQDSLRHHHAPTVEDVLTEFGIDWEHESDCEDRAALLKEYAAKLQLREDA